MTITEQVPGTFRLWFGGGGGDGEAQAIGHEAQKAQAIWT